MYKKLLSVILVLAAICSFTACSENKSEPDNNIDATISVETTVQTPQIPNKSITIGLSFDDGKFTYVTEMDDDRNTFATVTGLTQEYSSTTPTELIIPSSVTVNDNGIGYTLTVKQTNKNCFEGMKNIETVVLPDTLTFIGYGCFTDCSNLKNLTIGKNVDAVGAFAFTNCTGLASVNIPDSITVLGDYSFSGCTSLKEVNINTDSKLDKIGQAVFNECEVLTEFKIPRNVTEINYHALANCTFTSFNIPANVEIISDEAFSGCTRLEKFIVSPDNPYYCTDENGVLFNTDKTKLIAFPLGNSMTEYTVPDSVTEICTIAFENAPNIKTVNIPSSVVSINNFTFRNCPELKSINFAGTEEQWQAIQDNAILNSINVSNATVRCNANF